jgi:hypothetical protein
MVVDREVTVKGTLLMEGVMRMVGLMMIRGLAIVLIAKVIPVMMGEIPGTNPSRRHTPLGVIPMTW